MRAGLRVTDRAARGVATIGIAGLLGAGLLGAACPARAQPIVHVRAETRIELQVERLPTGARLVGTLRDDRGDPLPDRAVTMRVYPIDDRLAVGRAEGRTDGRGEVSAAFELAQSEYRVEADYPGDESYRGVRVEQRLDLARAHVRLGMALEGVGRLDRIDLSRSTHAFRVHAESRLGGAGLAITLGNELREVLAEGTTDEDGAVVFVVPSDALGPPAAGRLVVRTPGDELRAAAQTEVLVVRLRPTHLTLTATPSTIASGQTVQIAGRLSTSERPLARKAVGIFLDETHLVTLLTDDDGRFARDLTIDSVVEAPSLTARFQSDAPWRPAASSPPVALHVELGGGAPWPWLVGSILICLVGVALASRRGRPSTPAPASGADELPAPPGIAAAAATARTATSRDVGGRVFDADEARPIGVARVSLSGPGEPREATVDAAGAFRLDGLAEGEWTLTATAPGYESATARVRVPHRGEWSDARVGLRSLRQVVLGGYRPLAEALAPTRRWWAFWTARELATRAASEVRGEVTHVTRDVERAAYGEAPPTREEASAIERRARALADRIDPGS